MLDSLEKKLSAARDTAALENARAEKRRAALGQLDGELTALEQSLAALGGAEAEKVSLEARGEQLARRETALALLASYVEEIRIGLMHNGVTMLEMSDGSMRFIQDASILDFMEYYRVSLMNPTVLVGVFIGAMMSFLFCGLTKNAVGRAAQSMVEEVRRQIREIKGILTGEGTPDYARCVEISTRGAQREMLFPSLLAIVVPVAVGLINSEAGVME